MARIKIGKRDTPTDKPTHTPLTKQGNSKGNYEKMSGHFADGRSSSERSTGIDAKGREPIDPRMPNLSPG